MKNMEAIATLSQEEIEELTKIIHRDLQLVMSNDPKLSEINEPPDTPMKAYVRQAKMNVIIRKQGSGGNQ